MIFTFLATAKQLLSPKFYFGPKTCEFRHFWKYSFLIQLDIHQLIKKYTFLNMMCFF